MSSTTEDTNSQTPILEDIREESKRMPDPDFLAVEQRVLNPGGLPLPNPQTPLNRLAPGANDPAAPPVQPQRRNTRAAAA